VSRPALKAFIAGETVGQPAPEPVTLKGIGDFVSEYEAIKYTIDGVLPSGVLYGVTAKRGAGKTAFLTGVALSTITKSSDILGFEVEMGRVAYIIL
jgi:hypothetical protein